MDMNEATNQMSVAQAAEFRGVSRQTVGVWIRRQWLPATRIGSRWVVDREVLAGFEAPRGAYRARRPRPVEIVDGASDGGI